MKRSDWHSIGVITSYFSLLLVVFVFCALLANNDDNIGWSDITFMLIAVTAWTLLLQPVIEFVTTKKSTIKKTTTFIGKQVTVFDYELYENIGDLDDNEYYWKSGVVINEHKESDGYLLDVKTEDGRIVEKVGQNYLRNL
jgi:hypothetical protein